MTIYAEQWMNKWALFVSQQMQYSCKTVKKTIHSMSQNADLSILKDCDSTIINIFATILQSCAYKCVSLS